MRVSDGRVLGFGQAAILLGSRDLSIIPVLPTIMPRMTRGATRESIMNNVYSRLPNKC